MKDAIIKFESINTKEGIKEYAATIRTLATNGENDPLLIAKNLKALEILVKELKADKIIRECIIDEYDLYNQKDVEIYGCNFNVKESGVKYDYSGCNCEEHTKLLEEIDKLSKKRKEVEQMLKNLKLTGMADPDTGEVMYPPSKTSSDAIVIKLMD